MDCTDICKNSINKIYSLTTGRPQLCSGSEISLLVGDGGVGALLAQDFSEGKGLELGWVMQSRFSSWISVAVQCGAADGRWH